MKHAMLKIALLNGLLLGLTLSLSHAQGFTDWYYPTLVEQEKRARKVMQDNEFQKNEASRDVMIYDNPLRLNERFLDYGKFTIHSSGTLKVVEGKPESLQAQPIPFKIYVRRNEKMLDTDGSPLFFKKIHTEVEISQVLGHSQVCDRLIIDPVNPEHWRAKRILRVVK